MRRLLIATVLLGVAAPAFAGNLPTPFGFAPESVQDCLSSNGVYVPCALSDQPPTVAKPNTAAAVGDRSQVVTVSPNSGGPSQYPTLAIPTAAKATGTTGAIAATLAAIPNMTTYVCGFSVSPGSAATAITLAVTLTGVLGGTMTWAVGAPVTAVGTTGTILTQTFNPCLPASAANTAIAINQSALGTSGINADAQIWGYQR